MIKMTEFTKEEYEAMSVTMQSLFELQGDVYVTKDSLKVAALKASLNGSYAERDEAKSKLTAREQAEAELIANAKDEAYKEALAKNDTEKATKLLQEKLDDAERRAGETASKYKERLSAIAKDKEAVIISELVLLGTDKGKLALKRLLKDYVQVDPETGAETYLNDDGSASSLNKPQFISSIKENELFKPLLKADVPTHGGGQSNGSLGVGGTGDRPKIKSQKTNGYLATIK
jgi:hypothetical protein